MRTIIGSGVSAVPFNAASLAGMASAYFESATPEGLSLLVQGELTARVAANVAGPQLWVLAFEDLAGAGDGHTFTQRLFFADLNANPSSAGVDPALARFFYYQAAEATALQIARTALNTPIAALDAVAGVTAIELTQTGLAGASQGTRFTGQVLATMLGDVPTAATAVVGGGGDITVTGTNLLGTIADSLNLVRLDVPAGPILLTRAEVLAGPGGVWTALSIVIDTTLVPGAVAGQNLTVFVNGRQVTVVTT